MSTVSSLLEKLRLPHPQLHRHVIISLFQILGDPNSPGARDVISRCLTSSSPSAVDQAARELCSLSKQGLIKASIALKELQSALEGCDSRFVAVFVKAIGFLCRFSFKMDPNWGKNFDSVEIHPFVKVLSCREEVQAELIHQVLLFIAQNRTCRMESVTRFLRPFFMFSVIRKSSSISSSMFARDLVSAVASLSCSFPFEAISIIKLLTECLKYFPCTNEAEFKYLSNSAECVVDAFVVVLKEIVGVKMQLTSTVQACGIDIVDALFSLCAYTRRPYVDVELIVELSKRLLVAQKELGLYYLPEFASAVVSISVTLMLVEFEHEHLSILKLLIFLFKWKNENEHDAMEAVCCVSEELLYLFPLISLLSSPSKSVKAAAAYVLSAVERLLSGMLNAPIKTVSSKDEFLHMNKPKSIPFRLLHHLWFQESSPFPHTSYLELACSVVSEIEEADSRPNYWACQLRAYLLAVENLKVSPLQQSTENLLAGTYLLLSSVASILVMHPMLGSSAVDSLTAIGRVSPGLGMPLLQTLLFYNKMLCSCRSNSPEMLLKLLEILPSLASHSVMVPLIVQTILPMLQKDAKPVLYAVAIRLLCKTWIVTDRVFGSLQEFLDPNVLSDFISERQICISIAASIRDVCRHNPDRGVDLILSVSSCIESSDSSVRALGFESLAYLCEADVVDFYTAWDVIAKHMMDYSVDPIVAHGVCTVLRWGAMDVDAYPESSKSVMQILWNVATFGNSCSSSLWVKARVAAFKSLSHYEVEHLQRTFSDFGETNFRCLVTEDNAKILVAMEEFENKIIDFEHINRRKVRTQKRVAVHKVEKLLDVFPQAIFSQGNHKFSSFELPGAALLSLVFTPKDIHGTSRDLARLHSAYEKALLELSESLHVSRNILIALLSLQSWKAFLQRWIRAVVTFEGAKGSSTMSDKIAKAANDIFKILCKVAAEAIPRVDVNIALAIGALCTVVPPSTHSVISAASSFLLIWLVAHEHEHRQWSAAISLGLISNCLHATDKVQKLKVNTELLKAVINSKSYLVKGACGVGLGFVCQDLLTRIEMDNPIPEEKMFLQSIISALSMMLSKLCPSASKSLKILNENFLLGEEDVLIEDILGLPRENCDDLEEDAWGIAGLVMGLGNSVVALYRSGAYDAVLRIREILTLWIPQVDSSVQTTIFCNELTEVPLSMGACLALPSVMAFCQRTELINNDVDVLVNCYGSLISGLLHSRKSGTLYQNLLMTSCVGAGSLLSYISTNRIYSVRFDDVKYLLEILRDTYTHSFPPPVHLGGMLGVVNAFGAGAGDLIRAHPLTTAQHYNEQDSSFITGLLLSSPVFEFLSTSMVQELFVVAKESRDQQIKQYSAWAISFLREKLWSRDLQDINSQSSSTDSSVPYQKLAEDSLVLKLCLWLRDIDLNMSNEIIHATTISTVLRCLSKAPRLPSLDWGVIVRRCMAHGAKFSVNLREDCICFSLAHANDVSSLALLLDELTDISRFRTLELNLQSVLLHHLLDLLKIFSGSRFEKLSEDLVAYFRASVCPNLLRVSFWRGLHQCLNENFKESRYASNIEKCMECLFCILPAVTSDAKSGQMAGDVEEWSEAIRCLSKAPQDWLMNMLQVPNTNILHGRSYVADVAKRISARARLVRVGCITISELDKIKACILNTRFEGCWWNLLMDVAAAVSTADGNAKMQWLLDALETSCVAEYPSTALRFIGLLSGISCKYMPLLIVDPDTVLSDLPISLPSLLSEARWNPIAESAANKLWASMERICKWAARGSADIEMLAIQDGISKDEAPKSAFLACSLHETCVALKDYLPLQKQLKLANLEVPQLQ